MAILPQGAPLSFSGTATQTVYVDDLEYDFIIEAFDRPEFSNPRLRNAPTQNGSLPIIVTTFGNKPIQLGAVCAGDSPRPLTPDDANIDNIKQRFDINRWTIKLAPTPAAAVDAIFTVYIDHKIRFQRFLNHQAQSQMEVSYPWLTTQLQPETFSYLTSTGLSMGGTLLGGVTYTNTLIIGFVPGIAYSVYLPDGSTKTLKTATLIVDQRAIKAGGATS